MRPSRPRGFGGRCYPLLRYRRPPLLCRRRDGGPDPCPDDDPGRHPHEGGREREEGGRRNGGRRRRDQGFADDHRRDPHPVPDRQGPAEEGVPESHRHARPVPRLRTVVQNRVDGAGGGRDRGGKDGPADTDESARRGREPARGGGRRRGVREGQRKVRGAAIAAAPAGIARSGKTHRPFHDETNTGDGMDRSALLWRALDPRHGSLDRNGARDRAGFGRPVPADHLGGNRRLRSGRHDRRLLRFRPGTEPRRRRLVGEALLETPELPRGETVRGQRRSILCPAQPEAADGGDHHGAVCLQRSGRTRPVPGDPRTPVCVRGPGQLRGFCGVLTWFFWFFFPSSTRMNQRAHC
mmetsp:Transcript_21066/g.44232  ORF Transcript_21066/g.44232 Transcript_21066/m.44232 type:complete len:352 (+) Transcript_21066:274-1329(+)